MVYSDRVSFTPQGDNLSAYPHHDPHHRKSRFAALDDLSDRDLAAILKLFFPLGLLKVRHSMIRMAQGRGTQDPTILGVREKGRPKASAGGWLPGMDQILLPVLQTAALALARRLSRRNRPEWVLAGLLELREPTGPIRVVARTLRQEGPAAIVPDLIGLFCPDINVSQHTLERHRSRLRSPDTIAVTYPRTQDCRTQDCEQYTVTYRRSAKDPAQFTIWLIRRFLESLHTNS